MKNPLHSLANQVKAMTAKTAGAIDSHKSGPTLNILIPRHWPDEMQVEWCLRNGPEIIDQGQTQNISELKALQKGVKTIIWSPTADTLLINADLPTRSRSKINQALPFALEEQLLYSPEQNHFVYYIRTGLPLAVAVTSKAKLEQWLSVFRKADMHPPSEMYPQVLGQSLAKGSWSITIIGNELHIKTNALSGFSCQLEGNHVPLQLTNTLNALENDLKPGSIVYYRIDRDLDIKRWSDELGIDFVTRESDLWSSFQILTPELNLLQGEFRQKRKINPVLSRFVPAAAIVLIWITFSLFVNIWEWQSLKTSFENTNRQMRQLFKTSFPEAKTIVDPVLQMQRKFEAVSGSSGGYLSNDFIALLSQCAPALSALDSGAIENLRYNEKSLNISLGLPDFKSLEALKERLAAIGMQVKVVAANSRAEGIEGRLKITSDK